MWILTKMINELLEEMNNQKNLTSVGKTKLDEAENGHEFELRTITEKSTRKKKHFINRKSLDLSYLYSSVDEFHNTLHIQK
jgi:hypothetical protein